MTLRAALVYSNDDGFSLGTEYLRAVVAARHSPDVLRHEVWYHEPVNNLTSDYLGHWNAFLARCATFRPDVLAFSVFVWNQEEFVRLSQIARRLLPTCFILWGGAQTNSRRMALSLLTEHSWLDAVVRGEAEDTYPQVLAALTEGRPLGSVPGVTWRAPSRLVENPDSPPVDIRNLPIVFSARHLPLEPLLVQARTPTIAYETSRGCRQRCRFCLYGKPTLRAFPLERVAVELQYLLEGGVPFLRIADAHFGVSRPRAMQLFEIIAAHNRATTIDIYPDVAHVDADYVRAMIRAGCRVISLGIQSSNPDTLLTSDRRFDKGAFTNAVSVLRRDHNISLAADVIVGLPGDDYDKVKASVRFAFESGIARVHFAPLMAFPGTEFFEDADTWHLDHFPFTPPLVFESRTFSLEDYQKAVTFAWILERMQEEVPTLIQVLLASGPANLEAVVEQAGYAVGASPTKLYESPAFAGVLQATLSSTAIDLAVEALRFDQARCRQAAAIPEDLSQVSGERVVGEIRADAVLRVGESLRRLVTGEQESVHAFSDGRFGYLFPSGRSDPVCMHRALVAGLEQLRSGVRIDELRARIAESLGPGAKEIEDSMEAIKILFESGVFTLEPLRTGQCAALLRQEPGPVVGLQSHSQL